MTGCQCKSGFFTFRDCEEPPVKSCDECGREMCTRHTSPASGFTKCLDCWAKAEERDPEEHDSDTASDSDDSLDDEWTYGYRNSYYRRGYSPMYAGRYHDHYYDDYDVRSFEGTEGGDWDDSDGRGGFGDS